MIIISPASSSRYFKYVRNPLIMYIIRDRTLHAGVRRAHSADFPLYTTLNNENFSGDKSCSQHSEEHLQYIPVMYICTVYNGL